MFDLLIAGGEVIDGRGEPRRRADVGIVGDRISAIGPLTHQGATAAATIDASGLAVTPGFIDVHTHLDAQVFWDPSLSPSPLHGVTTVIGGNCGFTIAPLGDDPAHGDYLMRMLARVEGIPLEALQQGVPWGWQTTAEYFDAIDGNVAVNAGFKVGHSALRRVAMGDDSTTFRSDLPAGASRLYAEATGIEHVVCNGTEIVRHGQFTDARPGTLLRSGTHTTVPSLD